MKKLKVMTILGTRPEIIRLSRVMAKMDLHFNHIIVHTGQNFDYELNEIFFKDLGIRRPNHFMHAASADLSAAQIIGNVISRADEIFAEERPDAVLLLGDTNSSLAAISAKRRKIPIFHMEAGNRCYDDRVPEEINRRIVDHISDINLTYSSIAREYLLREGVSPDRIIKTGSPLREVLEFYRESISKSTSLSDLQIPRRGYFLVSAHREENIDDVERFSRFLKILNWLAENYSLPVIVSTHPRTRIKLDKSAINLNAKIRFVRPLGFFDYVFLQQNAKAVLSDSGTITEESSILNFPAINLREVHERPEGFEEATVMMVGMNLERLSQALSILETQGRGQERVLKLVADYEALNVSEKIVRIILSYTDFINRVVWNK